MTKPLPILTSGVIHVQAKVASDGDCYVALSWGSLSGRLSPDEARALAASMFLAAEAVNTDEFLTRFAKDLAKDQSPVESQRAVAWLLKEVHNLRERGQRDETHD
jgi:hypothetical protein